jgi:hypothetical protein
MASALAALVSRRIFARRRREIRRGRAVSGCAVVALWLLLAQVHGEDTGLSKGPVNPADIGTRCGVMAGRDDRAYLNCAEQERAARKAGESGQDAPSTIGRPRAGHDDATRRRYPFRDR